ncbi:hypothetical protein D9758_014577 [Tetrapyrgos nigripes]|uniref:C2H2-type domain-containing protein n=1 Tax=Tetrapyrgos nigripes TaxID=182062 RepID=A0A8H5FCQ1_9AGAR|nr:hypothetical protein D9758_014577 [Tetrapyrgos nigripes]
MSGDDPVEEYMRGMERISQAHQMLEAEKQHHINRLQQHLEQQVLTGQLASQRLERLYNSGLPLPFQNQRFIELPTTATLKEVNNDTSTFSTQNSPAQSGSNNSNHFLNSQVYPSTSQQTFVPQPSQYNSISQSGPQSSNYNSYRPYSNSSIGHSATAVVPYGSQLYRTSTPSSLANRTSASTPYMQGPTPPNLSANQSQFSISAQASSSPCVVIPNTVTPSNGLSSAVGSRMPPSDSAAALRISSPTQSSDTPNTAARDRPLDANQTRLLQTYFNKAREVAQNQPPDTYVPFGKSGVIIYRSSKNELVFGYRTPEGWRALSNKEFLEKMKELQQASLQQSYGQISQYHKYIQSPANSSSPVHSAQAPGTSKSPPLAQGQSSSGRGSPLTTIPPSRTVASSSPVNNRVPPSHPVQVQTPHIGQSQLDTSPPQASASASTSQTAPHSPLPTHVLPSHPVQVQTPSHIGQPQLDTFPPQVSTSASTSQTAPHSSSSLLSRPPNSTPKNVQPSASASTSQTAPHPFSSLPSRPPGPTPKNVQPQMSKLPTPISSTRSTPVSSLKSASTISSRSPRDANKKSLAADILRALGKRPRTEDSPLLGERDSKKQALDRTTSSVIVSASGESKQGTYNGIQKPETFGAPSHPTGQSASPLAGPSVGINGPVAGSSFNNIYSTKPIFWSHPTGQSASPPVGPSVGINRPVSGSSFNNSYSAKPIFRVQVHPAQPSVQQAVSASVDALSGHTPISTISQPQNPHSTQPSPGSASVEALSGHIPASTASQTQNPHSTQPSRGSASVGALSGHTPALTTSQSQNPRSTQPSLASASVEALSGHTPASTSQPQNPHSTQPSPTSASVEALSGHTPALTSQPQNAHSTSPTSASVEAPSGHISASTTSQRQNPHSTQPSMHQQSPVYVAAPNIAANTVTRTPQTSLPADAAISHVAGTEPKASSSTPTPIPPLPAQYSEPLFLPSPMSSPIMRSRVIHDNDSEAEVQSLIDLTGEAEEPEASVSELDISVTEPKAFTMGRKMYVDVPLMPNYAKRWKAQQARKRRLGNLEVEDEDEVVEILEPERQTEEDTVDSLASLFGNNSQEIAVANESITRLRRASCHWDDCDAVLNSVSKLDDHTSAHVEKTGPYRCLWQNCGRSHTSSAKLLYHLRTAHVLFPLRCAYKGCSETFNSTRLLLQHSEKSHGNGVLRPSAGPFTPRLMPLPDAPSQLPSYMMVAKPVVPCPISRSRHETLGPWILKSVMPPANVVVGLKHLILKRSREGGGSRTGPPGTIFDFVTARATRSCMPSRPAKVRDLGNLNSYQISKFAIEGEMKLFSTWDGQRKVEQKWTDSKKHVV